MTQKSSQHVCFRLLFHPPKDFFFLLSRVSFLLLYFWFFFLFSAYLRIMLCFSIMKWYLISLRIFIKSFSIFAALEIEHRFSYLLGKCSLISYLPSIIWGIVGTSVDDCLHLLGLWVYLRDIFLTNDGWKSVQPTIGSTTPGQVVTVYKKAEQASKHHSYVVSASVPVSGFLLWFLPSMDCYSET